MSLNGVPKTKFVRLLLVTGFFQNYCDFEHIHVFHGLRTQGKEKWIATTTYFFDKFTDEIAA